MLTVRKRNLAVLSEARQRHLPDRLTVYLLARFPHVFGEDEAAALKVVQASLASSGEYGFKEEEELRVYCDLAVMYGDDFHREPWAAQVLTRRDITPEKKVLDLRELVYESGALM